ncbi:MAG: FAD-dependent oxidoreductase [Desulfobacula sp.]|uniref:FAD-dependent oxidoreductase n=1 Tax=Desulfobacula sp. TaxID=2593537 RepID=UPI0025C464F1|nr:FAD-dependent oxidoreductase [Desulfobacula sp.]MCD4720325.1 FAD-dependent oxidoreductase [Desulfobacula sp.]
MFDVVIIGAGPAGTAAAFDLLTKGLKVLILDKYEFPRKKACAGGITSKAFWFEGKTANPKTI